MVIVMMELSDLIFVTIFNQKYAPKAMVLIDPPRALHGAKNMSHLRRLISKTQEIQIYIILVIIKFDS